MLTVLFGSFVILILIGCPIAVTLGASSVAALLMDGSFDLGIAIQRMFTGVNSFPLMAIPFFMLAGSLMELGGISSRIIRFADTLVGHYRGGLAFAAIIACMIFASISGSAVATVAAIGGIIIPEMRARKYPDGYSTAVVTAAGTMGPIIPPSTTFVIYASIAGVSVSDMFLGGYIPGILMGISLMIVAGIKARKMNLPKSPKQSGKEILKATKEAFLALLSPVIIVGGIITGWFTPTEAGAIGCIYSFVVGAFIYHELTPKRIFAVLKESALSSSIIMFLIATANIFSWILTVEQIPQIIKDMFMSVTDSKYVLLLLINLLLLVVGMFLDSAPALTMLVPVLAPLVTAYGIDLVHFGVVMCVNLCIGLLTPPVGTCMFVGCRVSKMPLMELVRNIWIELLTLIGVCFLITYVPPLVTFIPSLGG